MNRVYFDIYKDKEKGREWVFMGHPFGGFFTWSEFDCKYVPPIHPDWFIRAVCVQEGAGSCSKSLVVSDFRELGEIMTPIKEYINRYGTVYAASKTTGIHAQQLHRWIKAGAMVDGDGQVWIKAKGKLLRPVK